MRLYKQAVQKPRRARHLAGFLARQYLPSGTSRQYYGWRERFRRKAPIGSQANATRDLYKGVEYGARHESSTTVVARRKVRRPGPAWGLVAGRWPAQATIRETKVISRQPNFYHGWPTVCRCRSGRLLVNYSGGHEGHVCPFGRVELIQSSNDGATWSDAGCSRNR